MVAFFLEHSPALSVMKLARRRTRAGEHHTVCARIRTSSKRNACATPNTLNAPAARNDLKSPTRSDLKVIR
jgi:hypothetical protein